MRKSVLSTVLLVVFSTIVVNAQQKTCESNENVIEELNSITTKCTVDKTEKTTASGKRTKKLSVKVSSSTRYLKRRVNHEVLGLGDVNTSGVESLNSNTNASNTIQIAKTSNIARLKEKLSKEQLKNSFQFEEVDVIPAFDKCKSVKKAEGANCFNEEMMAHIQKHFRYPHEAVINKVQGNVWVRFVIDEEGNIANLKTLAPKNGKSLKQEAERVISKLSAFVPAKKGKKNVLVKYGFPINFSLEE